MLFSFDSKEELGLVLEVAVVARLVVLGFGEFVVLTITGKIGVG